MACCRRALAQAPASAKRGRPGRCLVLDQGLEGAQQDGITWPSLKATWAGRDPAEIEAAHRRGKQLVDGGWGAVRWR